MRHKITRLELVTVVVVVAVAVVFVLLSIQDKQHFCEIKNKLFF